MQIRAGGIPLRLLNSIAAARRGAKRNGGRGRVNLFYYGNVTAGVNSACAGLQRKVPAGISLPADVLQPAGKHGILCRR